MTSNIKSEHSIQDCNCLAECNRIVQTLSKRISDFESEYKCKYNYTIIPNPSADKLPGCEKLKDGVYWQIDASIVNKNRDISILRGKFTLLRFDRDAVKNLLIVVKDNTAPESVDINRYTMSTSTVYMQLAGSLFTTKVNNLINNIELRNQGAFIVLVGDNLSGIDLYVKALSDLSGKEIAKFNVNDVLKENTLIKKSITNDDSRIIYLSNFDYLFSDLAYNPKIPNRELTMIRHDLHASVVNNDKNIIVLSVTTPTILTPELSNVVDYLEDLTVISPVAVRRYVDKVFGAKHDLDVESLVSMFCSIPTLKMLSIASRAEALSKQNSSFDIVTYIEGQVANYKSVSSEFTKATGADFKITSPSVTLDRVVLSDENHEKLQMALSSLVHQDLVSNVWGWSEIDPNVRSIINFYGPPGTGKTLCANAIAHELSQKTGREFQLLSLNYSEIESMYVGEAPKKLERVFNFAKDKDIVLFFDEADSFLGKRIQNVSQGAEQAINSLRSTMLIQLEKYTGVVVFATNLTTNYDTAFKTRFLAEIEFPLPNEETCKKIFVKNIPSKLHGRFTENTFLTEEELVDISKKLHGLSGRDIKTIIWRVLLRQARINGASHKFCVDDFLSEIDIYKKEKQTDVILPNNITTSVTPASQELARKLGLTSNGTSTTNPGVVEQKSVSSNVQ